MGHCTQAALDVFAKEPPPADNPLVNRSDVVCTPHLGASTTEAQEGVALEIAQAVVEALQVRTCLLHSLPENRASGEQARPGVHTPPGRFDH